MAEVIIQPEAEDDILDSYDWYENCSNKLGESFMLSIDDCLSLIKKNPLMFPVVYKGVRRALIRRFPYAIFYLLGDNKAFIIAVCHCKRKAASWRNRLK